MLRYIIFAVLLYLLIRVLYKFFFKVPLDFKRYVNHMEQEKNEQKEDKKVGDVHIERNPKQKSKYDKDEGEIIDYEDVK